MKATIRTWIAATAAVLIASTATLRADDSKPTLPATGVNIVRSAGGWINVEATGNRLAVKFFDAEKKPVPPDVVRAAARVVYPARKDRRVVLNPDGDTLVSPPSVLPPLVFRIHLSLFVADGSEAESFVVQYPGEPGERTPAGAHLTTPSGHP